MDLCARLLAFKILRRQTIEATVTTALAEYFSQFEAGMGGAGSAGAPLPGAVADGLPGRARSDGSEGVASRA